jgi:hypothetical protein
MISSTPLSTERLFEEEARGGRIKIIRLLRIELKFHPYQKCTLPFKL